MWRRGKEEWFKAMLETGQGRLDKVSQTIMTDIAFTLKARKSHERVLSRE